MLLWHFVLNTVKGHILFWERKVLLLIKAGASTASRFIMRASSQTDKWTDLISFHATHRKIKLILICFFGEIIFNKSTLGWLTRCLWYKNLIFIENMHDMFLSWFLTMAAWKKSQDFQIKMFRKTNLSIRWRLTGKQLTTPWIFGIYRWISTTEAKLWQNRDIHNTNGGFRLQTVLFFNKANMPVRSETFHVATDPFAKPLPPNSHCPIRFRERLDA